MRPTNSGRRRFLGAASLVPAGAARSPEANVRRIDVHRRFVSPSSHALPTAKSLPAAPIPGLARRDFSPARTIERTNALALLPRFS